MRKAIAIIAFVVCLVCLASCVPEAKIPSESTESRSSSLASADGPDVPLFKEDGSINVAVPSSAGALRVEGSQLVDEEGQPVQLRGVSTHGLAWFPQYVNQRFFDELRADWGANVVRLALYTAESGGYCAGGDRAGLEQLVREGVAYAEQADLYAIVDWHVLSDQDPNAYIEDAKAFFGAMSAEFAGKSNVIYEICNEPNGAPTWAQVKAYAEQVIPVIRANDPDALVVVGTPEWSQRIDEAAADPLTFDNVMYALHFYAATHQQELRDRLAAAVAGGLPVFVTEFGICDASGNGAIDYASADAWVQLMDQLGVSYVCWNLSNKDESSALFLPDCAKVAGFEAADLSAEGEWLWGVLHGEAAVVPGATSDGTTEPEKPLADDALSGTDGSLAWRAEVVNAWEEAGTPCRQYAVTIVSNGAAVSSWSIRIPIGAAALKDSWNGTFDLSDGVLQISNASYNGTIPANGEIGDIGFIVKQA